MSEPLYRVSEKMAPLPGLDGKGRPSTPWKVASTTREEWGSLYISAGSQVNVTHLRGVPTLIDSYSYEEPFGYGPAQITFPQISPFDQPGAGDLSWMVPGFNVSIARVMPGTGQLVTIWAGFCASWEPQMSETDYSIRCQLYGLLFQTKLEPKPPDWLRTGRDIGVVIPETLNELPGRRFEPTVAVTTGILTRNRGGWSTVHDYVQELLSTAYASSDVFAQQWTIAIDNGRQPVMRLKDITTEHWTISMGQRGMLLSEVSDVIGKADVIYGEGVADDGCRWRNSRYASPASEPYFRPLVARDSTMPEIWNETTKQLEVNPLYDPSVLRVARYENFGSGVSIDEGAKSAQAQVIRDTFPGWIGTMTLMTDPEQGSRFDIRAGQNIAVRYHHGKDKQLFHIARVQVDPDSRSVVLEVDTNARDAVTLTGLLERDEQAATDPARRLNPPRRTSRQTTDEHAIFDCESGAGNIGSWAVTGGQWNIRSIPFATYGTIVRSYMATSPATRYAAGVFGQAVSVATLDTLVGNPLGSQDPWDPRADALSDAGLQVAWGSSVQAGGYYPGQQDKGSAVTGRMLDDAAWDYISSKPPWVWLVFYPEASTTLTGDFRAAPES